MKTAKEKPPHFPTLVQSELLWGTMTILLSLSQTLAHPGQSKFCTLLVQATQRMPTPSPSTRFQTPETSLMAWKLCLRLLEHRSLILPGEQSSVVLASLVHFLEF